MQWPQYYILPNFTVRAFIAQLTEETKVDFTRLVTPQKLSVFLIPSLAKKNWQYLCQVMIDKYMGQTEHSRGAQKPSPAWRLYSQCGGVKMQGAFFSSSLLHNDCRVCKQAKKLRIKTVGSVGYGELVWTSRSYWRKLLTTKLLTIVG